MFRVYVYISVYVATEEPSSASCLRNGKKEVMFPFTGGNICWSLRSITSTLSYMHSLCFHWVHARMFSPVQRIGGGESKHETLWVILRTQSNVHKEDVTTAEDTKPRKLKFCHAVFIKILQQSFQQNCPRSAANTFRQDRYLATTAKNKSKRHHINSLKDFVSAVWSTKWKTQLCGVEKYLSLNHVTVKQIQDLFIQTFTRMDNSMIPALTKQSWFSTEDCQCCFHKIFL